MSARRIPESFRRKNKKRQPQVLIEMKEDLAQSPACATGMQIVITMPVYEDWDAALALCQKIDLVFQQHRLLPVRLLLVDDGSTLSARPLEIPFRPQAIESVSILVLRRNLGHQRAIAVSLAYLQQHWKGDAVVVMDADGEDRPEDIPVLVEAMTKLPRPTAIFAERGKRLEKLLFRFSYHCYRLLHHVIAGRDIRFGNFSVLPWSQLDSLVVFPELWNHYAASFIKSRLPYIRVPCRRSARLSGQSRMNFLSLVVHGVSALFANQEVVGTRLLIMNLAMSIALLLLICVVVGIKLFTNLAIPGWASTVLGLLLILLGQSFAASFMLIFSIMMNRSHLGFLPIRDYFYFVSRETPLYP
jgi:glycosyltransferase involved in cell wall biosynthesis